MRYIKDINSEFLIGYGFLFLFYFLACLSFLDIIPYQPELTIYKFNIKTFAVIMMLSCGTGMGIILKILKSRDQ